MKKLFAFVAAGLFAISFSAHAGQGASLGGCGGYGLQTVSTPQTINTASTPVQAPATVKNGG